MNKNAEPPSSLRQQQQQLQLQQRSEDDEDDDNGGPGSSCTGTKDLSSSDEPPSWSNDTSGAQILAATSTTDGTFAEDSSTVQGCTSTTQQHEFLPKTPANERDDNLPEHKNQTRATDSAQIPYYYRHKQQQQHQQLQRQQQQQNSPTPRGAGGNFAIASHKQQPHFLSSRLYVPESNCTAELEATATATALAAEAATEAISENTQSKAAPRPMSVPLVAPKSDRELGQRPVTPSDGAVFAQAPSGATPKQPVPRPTKDSEHDQNYSCDNNVEDESTSSSAVDSVIEMAESQRRQWLERRRQRLPTLEAPPDPPPLSPDNDNDEGPGQWKSIRGQKSNRFQSHGNSPTRLVQRTVPSEDTNQGSSKHATDNAIPTACCQCDTVTPVHTQSIAFECPNCHIINLASSRLRAQDPATVTTATPVTTATTPSPNTKKPTTTTLDDPSVTYGTQLRL